MVIEVANSVLVRVSVDDGGWLLRWPIECIGKGKY